jgi:ribosomal-protein-alanine N-acetyltransferase
MELSDIEDILVVEKLSFSIPWSRDSFVKEIVDNNLAIYLVAKVNEKAVGYIGMWKVLNEGHITNVAVHPEFRHQGIGDQLVSELLSLCEKENIDLVTLEVRKSNQNAIKLYEKHGFVAEGIRKAYYQDNKEDAIIMWKR